MQTMPTYLANIGYRNPDSHVSLTPARHAFGCEFWEHLSKHPEKQADFDSSMKMSDMVPPAALPTYPFAANRVLTYLVDLFFKICNSPLTSSRRARRTFASSQWLMTCSHL